MICFPRRRALFSTLLLGAVAACPVLAQQPPKAPEKHAILDQTAAGDVSTVESRSETTLNVAGTVDGQEIPPNHLVRSSRRKVTDETLSMAGGRPTAVRHTYHLSRVYRVLGDGSESVTPSPLQGRSVTVRRQGSKVVVTADKGKVDPVLASQLTKSFGNTRDYTLPNREVAVGEEWTIPTRITEPRYFRGAKKADMTVTFAEVTEHRGHRCARLHVVIDLDWALGEFPFQGRLEGDVYHSLDIQRTISMETAGPITMTLKKLDRGRLLDLTGDGTTMMQWQAEWKKVAGKPVTAIAAGNGGNGETGK